MFRSREWIGAVLCMPALFTAQPTTAQPARALPSGYELIFDSDAQEATFLFSDANAWRVGGDAALELVTQSEYRPPHRSPLNIALLAPWLFGSFVLEVEVQQTGREYGHRDACFFFAFDSPERFYYAHLATSPDERAHNIFLVNQSARSNTAPVFPHGVDWGNDEWHTIRVERSLEKGETSVYFDGDETATVQSSDTTLSWGRVGVGSFDDTAKFRRLRVWAGEVREAGDSPW